MSNITVRKVGASLAEREAEAPPIPRGCPHRVMYGKCAECDKPFPIQGDSMNPPTSIPWWLAEVAYAEYARRYGTGQSLKKLAQRAGFGRRELLWLLGGKDPAKP